jgi:hypothetical protein
MGSPRREFTSVEPGVDVLPSLSLESHGLALDAATALAAQLGGDDDRELLDVAGIAGAVADVSRHDGVFLFLF